MGNPLSEVPARSTAIMRPDAGKRFLKVSAATSPPRPVPRISAVRLMVKKLSAFRNVTSTPKHSSRRPPQCNAAAKHFVGNRLRVLVADARAPRFVEQVVANDGLDRPSRECGERVDGTRVVRVSP